MLDAIGARSIENLFDSIPEAFRLKEPLNLPAAMSEQEIIEYFRARAAENSLRLYKLSRRGRLQPFALGGHRFADPARRISHFLHALSGGNQPGHAAGDLRVSDADVRAHRHGSRERLDVGRLDRHHRSRADGRAADRATSRGRGALAASGIPPGARNLHAQPWPAHRRNRIYEHGAGGCEPARRR